MPHQYLRILQKRHPRPSQDFVDKVAIPFLKQTEGLPVNGRDRVITFVRRFEYGTSTIPEFYKARKAIADYRFDKMIEYNCSPESETYWAS